MQNLDTYRERIADRLLAEQLETVGAVLVQGPKWCGKTTTAEQLAKSAIYIDNPKRLKTNLTLAETDPEALLVGDNPRLIDEWQLTPQLWDTARYIISHQRRTGLYIFTGSAVPPDKSLITHSGTGRFAWLTMRTMSLWESGDSSGAVSLESLFKQKAEVVESKELSINDLAYLVCRGGWPGVLEMSQRNALKQSFNYVDAVCNSDISRVDGVERNATFAARLLRSYARHQGGQVSVSMINADLSANQASMSDDTVASYLSALKNIFVIEDMPAWCPNLRSKTAIRTADTRYFTDSSIATAALGIGPDDLINDLNTFGLMFETLAVRDLRVYADYLDGKVFHYRDKNGLECDAVIHLRNGSYGLIEIKLGGDTLIDDGAKTLLKLSDKIDTDKMNPPSFLMVLTGLGSYAYKRKDGVWVVPIASLKN